jgi:pimeloyl-ACP methyl ester carboxylesterase
MFLRIGGVPHHVVTEGSGPCCVLSAGLGLSWFDWDAVVPLLAPHRTVVRFDRPGHGLSAPAAVAPTAAGEAHRIAAVLDAVGVRGPATVVGHSVAGFHAEAFARLHPARTAGLVLVDSSVEEDARAPAAPGLRAALSRAGGGDPAPPEPVRRVYRTSRVLRGALLENTHYRATAAELLALRASRPLPPGIPVTVLAATGTPGGGRRWAARQRELALALGGVFEETVSAGHLMMPDRPDAIARAVLREAPARHPRA